MRDRRLIIAVTVGAGEAVIAPLIPLEAAIAVVIAGAGLCLFLYRSESLAWAGRVGRHFLPQSARDAISFREMSGQIDRFRQTLMADNKGPHSIADLHMPPGTTSEWKLLVYKLNELGINPPKGTDIVELIDWLPYLQALSQDGKLEEARQLNPYTRTVQRFTYARRSDKEPPAASDDERPRLAPGRLHTREVS